MKNSNLKLLFPLVALPVTLMVTASKSPNHTNSSHIERGRYLVNAGGCNDCHTPHKLGPHGPEPDMARFLSGHPANAKLPPPPHLPAGPWIAATTGDTAWSGPWGISYSANLTPAKNSGLGIWTEEMFIKAMRTGRHFGVGRQILPPMPWQSLSQLTDEDLKAVFAYLKSLPPIENQVPDPLPLGGKPEFE